MIGNDVVDLELAKVQSNWRRKGYLQKIFTAKEITLIQNAINPDVTVWTMWTCKESAYKIINRQNLERLYNPLKFECAKGENNQFHVIFESQKIFCRSEITEKFIYTEAVSNECQFNEIEKLNDLKDVIKIRNIPICGVTGNPVSITHHGNYKFATTLRQTNLIPSLERSFRNDNARR